MSQSTVIDNIEEWILHPKIQVSLDSVGVKHHPHLFLDMRTRVTRTYSLEELDGINKYLQKKKAFGGQDRLSEISNVAGFLDAFVSYESARELKINKNANPRFWGIMDTPSHQYIKGSYLKEYPDLYAAFAEMPVDENPMSDSVLLQELVQRIERGDSEHKDLISGIRSLLEKHPELITEAPAFRRETVSPSDRLHITLQEHKAEPVKDPTQVDPIEILAQSMTSASSKTPPTGDDSILEDLDPDEQKEFQIIQQSKTLYNQYVKEHQSKLQSLDWIALYNNDYSTVRVFKNQDQAFEYCRGHRPKFYKQYYGPNVSRERINRAIETGFGQQSQHHPPRGEHPMYAYVEGQILDPEDEKNCVDVTFMIDTGATVCLGRRDVLKLKMKLQMHDGGLIDGLGDASIPTIYVETKIRLKGSNGTYLPPRLALIAYEIKKPLPENAQDWLLGQNYLALCKHTWTGLSKVELEPLE